MQELQMDHDVTEILGKPFEVEFTSEVPTLWVMGIDGNEYGMDITRQTPLRRLARFVDVDLEDVGAQLIVPGAGDFRKQIFNGYQDRDDVLFRVLPDDTLFAVVSQVWKSNDVENILPLIEEVMPGHQVAIEPSTGINGGTATITLETQGDIDPMVSIAMGIKDGLHSLRVRNAASIIQCTNQLTLEIAQHFKSIIPKSVAGFYRQRHCSKVLDEDWLRETIENAHAATRGLMGNFDEAREWELDDPDARLLLSYYYNVGRMSQKTARGVYEAYLDPDIAQDPDTMYGMAMALSWYGTHPDAVADGVARRCRILAGEITLVAEATDRLFSEIVEPRMKDVATDIFEGMYSEVDDEEGEDEDDEA